MACNEQPEDVENSLSSEELNDDQSEKVSEFSDVNCNQKDNDVPQTSPEKKISNETVTNMNDLKLFEFNSADDVRQRMREVFADSAPNLNENDEDFITVDVGDQEHQRNKLRLHLMSKSTGTDDLKLGDEKITQTVKPPALRISSNNNTGTSRKRPGRPPKAGPSKKRKEQRFSKFYRGKLSNVVFLKRNRILRFH